MIYRSIRQSEQTAARRNTSCRLARSHGPRRARLHCIHRNLHPTAIGSSRNACTHPHPRGAGPRHIHARGAGSKGLICHTNSPVPCKMQPRHASMLFDSRLASPPAGRRTAGRASRLRPTRPGSYRVLYSFASRRPYSRAVPGSFPPRAEGGPIPIASISFWRVEYRDATLTVHVGLIINHHLWLKGDVAARICRDRQVIEPLPYWVI